MDDTRHITKDQWADIVYQLEYLVDISSDVGPKNMGIDRHEEFNDEIKSCAKKILDILCLAKPDIPMTLGEAVDIVTSPLQYSDTDYRHAIGIIVEALIDGGLVIKE